MDQPETLALRWRIAIRLAPALIAALGVALFQIQCAMWCQAQEGSGFRWIEGFAPALITACSFSTVLTGLAYLAMWQRRATAAGYPTSQRWLIGGACLTVAASMTIVIIVLPIATTGDLLIFPAWLIAALIAWVVALGVGDALRDCLERAWGIPADQRAQWRHCYSQAWQRGWGIICAGGCLVPIISFVAQVGQIPSFVAWIGCWCVGWWSIGTPVARWLAPAGAPGTTSPPQG